MDAATGTTHDADAREEFGETTGSVAGSPPCDTERIFDEVKVVLSTRRGH